MLKNNQKYVERCFVASPGGGESTFTTGNSPRVNGDALFGVKFFPCEVFHFFQIFLIKKNRFSKHPMIGDWGMGNFGMPQTTLLENHNFWHVGFEVWDLFFGHSIIPWVWPPLPGFQWPPELWTIFRLGNPYKPSFATVTGPHPNYTNWYLFLKEICKRHAGAPGCSAVLQTFFSIRSWHFDSGNCCRLGKGGRKTARHWIFGCWWGSWVHNLTSFGRIIATSHQSRGPQMVALGLGKLSSKYPLV